GVSGSVAATAGVTLPSFILVLTVIAFFARFKHSPYVKAALSGIRPATAGMIASAVIFISQSSIITEQFFSLQLFRDPLSTISIPSVIIFILTLAGSGKWKIGNFELALDPIILTILAGALGAFIM
ncbi:MAG: chromate transporter, partial [Spirochaetota bacterium]